MPAPRVAPTAANALPLVGHAPWLLRDPLGYLGAQRELAPVVRLLLGRTEWYVINSPLAAVQVLTDPRHFDKGGPFIEAGRVLAGNGIITCDEAEHRLQRPVVQPAFHRNRVARYAPVMQESIMDMIGEWHDGQRIDVNQAMYRLAASVVARTLVATPAGRPAAELMAAVLPDLLAGLVRRMLVPVPGLHRLPTRANRRFTASVAAIDSAAAQVVQQYRDLPDQHDLLSRIVAGDEESGRRPSDREVRDQIVTILSAGVETTASLTAWTWHVLAGQPAVEQKLWAEIDTVLGGRAPAFEDIPRLPYTKQVLTEVLRLHPPTWILSRYTVKDATVADVALPCGSNVVISPHALHRDPAAFADPHTFDPDRWTPHRVTPHQKLFFLAFGAGRRRCLGELFGLTEATLAVATIAGRWAMRHVRPRPVRPVVRFLLNPADQPMVLSRRGVNDSSAPVAPHTHQGEIQA